MNHIYNVCIPMHKMKLKRYVTETEWHSLSNFIRYLWSSPNYDFGLCIWSWTWTPSTEIQPQNIETIFLYWHTRRRSKKDTKRSRYQPQNAWYFNSKSRNPRTMKRQGRKCQLWLKKGYFNAFRSCDSARRVSMIFPRTNTKKPRASFFTCFAATHE